MKEKKHKERNAMELIEDTQDYFTIKLDWKRDLNVIYAVLMSAGNQQPDINEKGNTPTSQKLNTVRHLLAKQTLKTP